MAKDAPAQNLTREVEENLARLAGLMGRPLDLHTELHGPRGTAAVACLMSLIDLKDLHAQVLEPLSRILTERVRSAEDLATRMPAAAAKRRGGFDALVRDLLDGRAAIFLDGSEEALTVAVQGRGGRKPKEPEAERVIRGPREGFTEDIEENLGMVRRWIKDPNLRAEHLEIGRRTRTAVSMVYLSDVAQPAMVDEVRRRLSALDIDGIVDSGYIEQLIKDRRVSILPLTQYTERTDKATAAILEGRVAILVDKSPNVILVPVTINELYQSTEDYYFDFWIGSFLRLIRLLGNNLSVALPGLYVALVAVNPELLPTHIAVMMAASRLRIPIPLVLEVFLLELAVEFFREAGLRLPGAIGETMGVASGVLVGAGAVMAGFVSPATLVIVAVTAIASFTAPNYSVGIAWRLLKYCLLLAATVLGLYGLTLAGMLILIHAADVKSFGVSYLAPWAPLQIRELEDGPVRAPFWSRWVRPRTYRPQDLLRSGGTKREDEDSE